MIYDIYDSDGAFCSAVADDGRYLFICKCDDWSENSLYECWEGRDWDWYEDYIDYDEHPELEDMDLEDLNLSDDELEEMLDFYEDDLRCHLENMSSELITEVEACNAVNAFYSNHGKEKPYPDESLTVKFDNENDDGILIYSKGIPDMEELWYNSNAFCIGKRTGDATFRFIGCYYEKSSIDGEIEDIRYTEVDVDLTDWYPNKKINKMSETELYDVAEETFSNFYLTPLATDTYYDEEYYNAVGTFSFDKLDEFDEVKENIRDFVKNLSFSDVLMSSYGDEKISKDELNDLIAKEIPYESLTVKFDNKNDDGILIYSKGIPYMEYLCNDEKAFCIGKRTGDTTFKFVGCHYKKDSDDGKIENIKYAEVDVDLTEFCFNSSLNKMNETELYNTAHGIFSSVYLDSLVTNSYDNNKFYNNYGDFYFDNLDDFNEVKGKIRDFVKDLSFSDVLTSSYGNEKISKDELNDFIAKDNEKTHSRGRR